MPGILDGIERPKEGEDPYQLWRIVDKIMDRIDGLTVTILPKNPGARVTITAGDISIDLNNFLPDPNATPPAG